MAKIVVIGSLNMDLVAVAPRLPHPGETLMGSRFVNTPGGKGANQAYAAGKLGGEVAMLGRVGRDDYGKQMCANLASVGCDVAAVRPVDGPSGVALIFVAESGQNSIIVAPGANDKLTVSSLHADDARLIEAQFVLLQLETPLNTVVAAAQAAKRHGARVILDPAPAPASLPDELLTNVDILTPNEAEASLLVEGSPRELSADEARDIAIKLQARGVKTVIVKMGAKGCLLAEGGGFTHIPAPKVNPVDTTAAGDVFNAAFAVACSERATLQDACRFAVRAAALSVTRLGAQQSMPDRNELNAFYPTT